MTSSYIYKGRPDMTFVVDWVLSNNYLSIYLHLQGGQIAPSTHIQNGKLYVIFSLFLFVFVANSPVTLKMGQGH